MEITFKGTKIHTIGELPKIQSQAPEFSLVKNDLSTVSLKDIKERNIILNIFVSVDTDVCATSVKKFHQEASKLPNTLILNVSMDLPFAFQRFCAAENIQNAMAASAFRNPEFGKDYGVTIIDGPLKGLLSRAIVILDENRKIIYREQVPEITQEPNYDAVLSILGK